MMAIRVRRWVPTTLLIAAAFVWSVPGIARAEPKPSPTPVEWELKFTFQNPQRITVRLPGESSAKTYWYMLYRVVNDTGEDRDFLPLVTRVAEIESELPADQIDARPDEAPRLITTASLIGLAPTVYRAIQKRHAKTHPFLVPPVESIGRIKQGADNAIDSVVIFDDIDPRVSSFTVYVGGLSGERKQVSNPAFNAAKAVDDKNPRFFVMQKTLAIPYRVPGTERTRRTVEPGLGRIYWVMR